MVVDFSFAPTLQLSFSLVPFLLLPHDLIVWQFASRILKSLASDYNMKETSVYST
jgi:hypothetical protein